MKNNETFAEQNIRVLFLKEKSSSGSTDPIKIYNESLAHLHTITHKLWVQSVFENIVFRRELLTPVVMEKICSYISVIFSDFQSSDISLSIFDSVHALASCCIKNHHMIGLKKVNDFFIAKKGESILNFVLSSVGKTIRNFFEHTDSAMIEDSVLIPNCLDLFYFVSQGLKILGEEAPLLDLGDGMFHRDSFQFFFDKIGFDMSLPLLFSRISKLNINREFLFNNLRMLDSELLAKNEFLSQEMKDSLLSYVEIS